MKNESDSPRPNPYTYVAVLGVGVGLLLAYGASRIVDPVLIWGGTKCHTDLGVYACYGYPPTGVVFAVLIGFFLTMTAAKLLEQAWGWVHV